MGLTNVPLPGAHSADVGPSVATTQGTAWVVSARLELDDLRTQYGEWFRSNSLIVEHGLAETTPEQLPGKDGQTHLWFLHRASAERMVRFLLWQLWRKTGYCAFGDTPPEQLLQTMPRTIDRYTKFLDAKRQLPLSTVLRGEIESNIDLLNGHYWWYALNVLTSTIVFDRFVTRSIHGILELPSMGAADRAAIHDAMQKWYAVNRDKMRWNGSLNSFVDAGDGLALTMPATLFDTVAAALR
jgi:hypothetical protein